jgi:hypothetical protein
VDQLVSITPGYIAQLHGKPTLKQYHAATIFVNHFSWLSYIHIQKLLVAKQSFERYAHTHGIIIKHYHADNGFFANNKFREEVRERANKHYPFAESTHTFRTKLRNAASAKYKITPK